MVPFPEPLLYLIWVQLALVHRIGVFDHLYLIFPKPFPIKCLRRKGVYFSFVTSSQEAQEPPANGSVVLYL